MWFEYVALSLLIGLVVLIAVSIKQKNRKLLTGTFAFILIGSVSFYATLEDYQEKRLTMLINDFISDQPSVVQ
ncbi:MAG: hypothetical protein MJK04_08325 [Psychrosphaera sp.]|nr:hypothetical protein [Psychrosphaera sp.]